MKKTHLYVASLLILAILSFLLLFQLINEKSSNPILGTIDFSNTYATVSTIYQRKTFFADGYCWVFYCNGTHFLYTTSSDGLNWRTPTVLMLLSSASAVSLWYNGEVHYALASGRIGEPVVYRKGEIMGNNIVWSDQQIAIQGTTTYEYYNGYCTVDSDGHPWVSCMCYDGENHFWTAQVARANSTNGEIWGSPMQLSNGSFFPLRTCILPLPEARIYAISVSEVKVEGRLWNGTEWQHVETITNQIPTQDYGYSAVTLNNEIHLALLQSMTNDILYYQRYANGSWSETLVEVGQGTISFPVLSADPPRNILYCTWIKDGALQLRKKESGNWVKVAEVNLALISPQALSCFYYVSDEKIGVALLEKISPTELVYRLRYYVFTNL
jgi:hypothetical protein